MLPSPFLLFKHRFGGTHVKNLKNYLNDSLGSMNIEDDEDIIDDVVVGHEALNFRMDIDNDDGMGATYEERDTFVEFVNENSDTIYDRISNGTKSEDLWGRSSTRNPIQSCIVRKK